MEIAIFVLGALALGFGAWVFVLIKAQGGLRDAQAALSDEAADAKGERDLLSAENARLIEESKRVGGDLFEAKAKAEESGERVVSLSVEIAEINERLSGAEKRYQDLVNDEKRLVESFEAIGGKSLRANQEALSKFLTDRLKDADKLSQAELDERKVAIEALVKPISETLHKTREQLVQLDERVRASGESNQSLKEETQRLTKALSRPEIRGQYGEIQLRRVAELAGMTGYCDFTEQVSVRDEDGQLQRPDMIVTLPNERIIVVDAKANINAYIEAVNAPTDEERERQMDRFARHMTEQVKKLADKKYWSLFDGNSAEFVVMFVPGDHFIDAALARNPDLLDIAAQQGVIMASPSTLIGLLRAVHVGWREQSLTEQARELFILGKELHDRAATAFEHAGKLGDSIRQSVERYNKLVGSIDSRMMPTLKKFEDAGAKSGKALVEPKRVEGELRLLAGGEEGE
ncbi:MAG: DNA recombination protein RmuC [Phycisphaerales bacterium]|nr:DNA recombination protein RmuC [Phycisphaerales bacterium]